MSRLANWLLPIVAARATAWPSTHSQHGHLLEEIRELFSALEGLVERVEWDVPLEARPATLRGALIAARKALEDA